MPVTRKKWILFFLLVYFQHVHGYRKYYIEDECMPSSKKQKINLRLPASGQYSAGELRSNRFGTYSRTERNCLLKLSPPDGYGVLLTVLKIDFRNPEKCRDFIQFILSEDEEEEKLCGYREFGSGNKTFFSDDEVKILYHISGEGIGFNTGVRLIFTVTKLANDECSRQDEFKCQNSHCIWAGLTCDGINNCGDASDENYASYPFCRTYQQISKNLFSLLAEITPLASAAVALGFITLVTVIVTMCVCCCRTRSEKPAKTIPFSSYSPMNNNGYMPIPGYNGTVMPYSGHMQPLRSNVLQASTPLQYYHGRYPSAPLVQQKVEIRCKGLPAYDA